MPSPVLYCRGVEFLVFCTGSIPDNLARLHRVESFRFADWRPGDDRSQMPIKQPLPAPPAVSGPMYALGSLPARTPVYLLSESPFSSPPSHSASRTMVRLLLSTQPSPSARWTCTRHVALQLATAESFRELKFRLRSPAGSRQAATATVPRQLHGSSSRPRLVPASSLADSILHPASASLDLWYPMPNQMTCIHPHQAMKDACLRVSR